MSCPRTDTIFDAFSDDLSGDRASFRRWRVMWSLEETNCFVYARIFAYKYLFGRLVSIYFVIVHNAPLFFELTLRKKKLVLVEM